jgi:hypothetical protein
MQRLMTRSREVESRVTTRCKLVALLCWIVSNKLQIRCVCPYSRLEISALREQMAGETNVKSSQTSQIRLLKSVKSDSNRRNRRKNLLVVRRLIDAKGFHTKTEVDIISKRVADVMRDINSDVEGISLNTKNPIVRRNYLNYII